MTKRFVIIVREFRDKSAGIAYGNPYAMRNEHGCVQIFNDEQYAEFLAKELNNSPIRSYTVEPARGNR